MINNCLLKSNVFLKIHEIQEVNEEEEDQSEINDSDKNEDLLQILNIRTYFKHLITHFFLYFFK